MVHKPSRETASAIQWFENDVKMYGTQAIKVLNDMGITFENDVKMYGTQAMNGKTLCTTSLRMM